MASNTSLSGSPSPSDGRPSTRSSLSIDDNSDPSSTVDSRAGPAPHEREEVAVALPPRLSPSRTAGATGVVLSGSAALDVLDQLLASNGIGKERAARLRRKYNLLKETLECSRSVENSLLVQAKELGKQLNQQQRVLEQCERFPDGDDTESSRLRQVALQHRNQLDQSHERMEKLQQELHRLKEEQAELQKDYEKLPKKEELDTHTKELSRQGDELKDEIALRSQDAKRYADELDRKQYKLTAAQEELDELKELDEKLQDELVAVRIAPINIPKQIDAVKKQCVEREASIKEQKALLVELDCKLEESGGKAQALSEEQNKAVAELQVARCTRDSLNLGLDRLTTDIHKAKEREATLLEDRATIEIQLKHRTQDHKNLQDSASIKNKEKERELKQLKRGQLQLDVVQQSRDLQGRQSEALQQSMSEQTAQLEALGRQREELSSEVEQLRIHLTQQQSFEEGDRQALEHKARLDLRLKEHCREAKRRYRELCQGVVSMGRYRDQEAKMYYNMKHQQQSIANDLRMKDFQCGEQRKRLRELETQLKDYAEAYETVKTERNKLHSLIQCTAQLAVELREKIKVFKNEAEILRDSAVKKERILHRCALVHTSKQLERDTHKQEVAKLQRMQDELAVDLDSSRIQLQKLTNYINHTEQQLNRFRRHYEGSVQERNDLGLQLIERNEEVCVFYEKMNLQDSVVRKANMDMDGRQDEIKFLQVELSKIHNDLLVQRKLLPEKDSLESELSQSQIELKECEQRLQALEAAVESASDPSRMRLLSGSDPSRAQLRARIQALESRLADREQQLLEKELLHEQVTRLTDRCQHKTDGQRDTALQVARKVNEYQTQIRDVTRRMMAIVSELSMQQAANLQLQQEVKEREVQLEQAYTRLEHGEAPDNQTESEWERQRWGEEVRGWEEAARRGAEEEEEASHLLPNGTYTTALPRPNAYLPLGAGELPVPKPYGSHAPFKPSALGANVRHIRKPNPKPIDI